MSKAKNSIAKNVIGRVKVRKTSKTRGYERKYPQSKASRLIYKRS